MPISCSRCGGELLEPSGICPTCGLPPGVAAMGVSEDGRKLYVLDPLLLNMRWPGLSIDSSSFKSLSPDQRLFELSSAFVRAARALCEHIASSPESIDWPSASVCYYCLHISTELFLKAVLFRLGEPPKKLGHDVPDLRKRYRELLPDASYDFSTIWWIGAEELNSALGASIVEGVDRTPDQLFRYGMDKTGSPSGFTQMFTPGYFFNLTTMLTERWRDIWSRLPEAPRPANVV